MSYPHDPQTGLIEMGQTPVPISTRITQQLASTVARVKELEEISELLAKNPDIEKLFTLLARNQLLH